MRGHGSIYTGEYATPTSPLAFVQHSHPSTGRELYRRYLSALDPMAVVRFSSTGSAARSTFYLLRIRWCLEAARSAASCTFLPHRIRLLFYVFAAEADPLAVPSTFPGDVVPVSNIGMRIPGVANEAANRG
jgi:hypothetical protein